MKTFPPIPNPTAGELSSRALKSLLVCFGRVYGEQRLRSVIRQANIGQGIDLDYFRNENN